MIIILRIKIILCTLKIRKKWILRMKNCFFRLKPALIDGESWVTKFSFTTIAVWEPIDIGRTDERTSCSKRYHLEERAIATKASQGFDKSLSLKAHQLIFYQVNMSYIKLEYYSRSRERE